MRLLAFLSIVILSSCTNDAGKAAAADSTASAKGSASTGSAAADSSMPATKPAAPPANFKDQYANVNGVNIHYVIGGEGEPLVLIHGFGQNWYMWNRLLPELSKHFTVVAPDLRGVGESDKPAGGYDKVTMATDIHELVKKLGFKSIDVVGHDIGMMVAYAYAAQYRTEVKKVALLDALLPGVDPVWTDSKNKLWWFGFFARPIAGDLVKGKAGEFLTDFWPQVGHLNDAFTKEETAEFIRAYSVPGATTGSFHWFGSFPDDAVANRAFMKQKLDMPMLAMGAEFSSASYLATHCRLVAKNVTEVKITGAGHWIVQEQTEQVSKGLMSFLLTAQ